MEKVIGKLFSRVQFELKISWVKDFMIIPEFRTLWLIFNSIKECKTQNTGLGTL